MKNISKLIIFLLALIVIPSCRTTFDALVESNDIPLKMKAGIDYYNSGKYRRAASIFESMLLLTQGSPQEDSVYYYNAMSNYRYGDYSGAEANFEKFLEVFPNSKFSEESKFLRIKCLYEGTYRWELDQVPTQRAMALISEFMYDNPNSQYIPICQAMMAEFKERLDRKDYEAARLYYNMEDYKASHAAFKTVLKDNSDNQYREQILYYTALSSFKYAQNSIKERQKERYMTYIDDYYNFIGEYPNSPDRRVLDTYFARAQRFVGLKVGLDSAQLAAVASLAESEGRGSGNTDGARRDRYSTKKAIKEAQKLVKEAEKRNEIARKIEDEKRIEVERAQRKADKLAEKKAIREAAKAYRKEKAEKKRESKKQNKK